ncbi:MAG TPA: class I SAM-dependent methyltransferase [Dehalococcoidia bacterium]|nr:class I SAM-dependent methyltransferase [Dehalococcoidia bacterium]
MTTAPVKSPPETGPIVDVDHEATRVTQRRYARLARLYDAREWIAERAMLGRLRRAFWTLVPAGGHILEVGVGTGKNMPLYPAAARVTAIDLVPAMAERAMLRATKVGANVDLALMDAQELALRDATFDIVAATFVFCSVPDPILGLREVRRVLRPEGRLFLMEHVRAENAVLGWIMDRVNPLAVRLSGANINRRTVENVRAAGFDVRSVRSRAGLIRLIEAVPSADA